MTVTAAEASKDAENRPEMLRGTTFDEGLFAHIHEDEGFHTIIRWLIIIKLNIYSD